LIARSNAFGADKIPEIARDFRQRNAPIENATEDIKSEITQSAEENGLDVKSLTEAITRRSDSAKQGFNKMVNRCCA